VWSCLHYAAWYNHPTLVDVLLAHGAPVDQPTAQGASPLFLACEKGHSEIARKLLDAGADIDESRCDINALLNNAS
jgi:ankyrin repeat protein